MKNTNVNLLFPTIFYQLFKKDKLHRYSLHHSPSAATPITFHPFPYIDGMAAIHFSFRWCYRAKVWAKEASPGGRPVLIESQLTYEIRISFKNTSISMEREKSKLHPHISPQSLSPYRRQLKEIEIIKGSPKWKYGNSMQWR